MTWKTQVSGWVHGARSRRWPGTSSPSRTTTAAMSQCPRTTTTMAAARSRSTTRLRVAGVVAARVADGGEVHAPAWPAAIPCAVVSTRAQVAAAGRANRWCAGGRVPWNGAHDRPTSSSSSSTPRCAWPTATPPPASSSTVTGRCTAPTRRMPRSTAPWSSAPRASATTRTHWVERQVEFFAARGQVVEWKTYGYDEPADLPERLVRAGFVAAGPGGRAARPVRRPRARRRPARGHPAARDRRPTRTGSGCGSASTPVWGEDTSWVNDALRAEQRPRPDLLTAVVAEDAATLEVLSYGVLRLTGHRLLRAVGWLDAAGVAAAGACTARWSAVPRPAGPRARLPATPASTPRPTPGPILVGLGMHAVADTRPYVLDPGEWPPER